MRTQYVYLLGVIFASSLLLLWYSYTRINSRQVLIPQIAFEVLPSKAPTALQTVKPLPPIKILPQATQMFQTFNNCGPATLGMILSRYGINIPQQQLADDLRPNNNPQGIGDDKSVQFSELAEYVQKYNLIAFYRPNGSIEKLKQFIAADVAVVTRTWLNPGEDIGHYRVIRGYDDTTGEIVQDDSYHGPNLRYSYDVFLKMWQPFNYDYLVIVPKEKEEAVRAILDEEVDEQTAWKNALTNAEKETRQNNSNPYPVFNMVVASYYLGKPQDTVRLYEQAASQLPRRMLWYQIEPIQAYQQVGNADRVFELTDQILNDGNFGFSELYVVRAKALLDQQRKEEAKVELEKALYYHKGSETVLEILNSI